MKIKKFVFKSYFFDFIGIKEILKYERNFIFIG